VTQREPCDKGAFGGRMVAEPSLTLLRAGQYTAFLKLSGIGHDAAIAGLRWVHGK
jgi:hypothetical protein